VGLSIVEVYKAITLPLPTPPFFSPVHPLPLTSPLLLFSPLPPPHPPGSGTTLKDTLVSASAMSLSPMTRPVTAFPALPAIGESFGPKTILRGRRGEGRGDGVGKGDAGEMFAVSVEGIEARGEGMWVHDQKQRRRHLAACMSLESVGDRAACTCLEASLTSEWEGPRDRGPAARQSRAPRWCR
jgi:hypothetical protein